jgi:hypothetical protein
MQKVAILPTAHIGMKTGLLVRLQRHWRQQVAENGERNTPTCTVQSLRKYDCIFCCVAVVTNITNTPKIRVVAMNGSQKYLCFGRCCKKTVSAQQLVPLSSVQFFFSAVLRQPRAMFFRRTDLVDTHDFFWKDRTRVGHVAGCKRIASSW